jgi:hypothetical protein
MEDDLLIRVPADLATELLRAPEYDEADASRSPDALLSEVHAVFSLANSALPVGAGVATLIIARSEAQRLAGDVWRWLTRQPKAAGGEGVAIEVSIRRPDGAASVVVKADGADTEAQLASVIRALSSIEERGLGGGDRAAERRQPGS